jgi:peptide/nickel transport system ATP-binding protein
MYLGQIVEAGPASEVLNNPKHPYTQTLLAAAPSLENPLPELSEVRIGELPNNRILPAGCYYRERCSMSIPDCAKVQNLLSIPDSLQVKVRCHVALTRNQ